MFPLSWKQKWSPLRQRSFTVALITHLVAHSCAHLYLSGAQAKAGFRIWGRLILQIFLRGYFLQSWIENRTYFCLHFTYWPHWPKGKHIKTEYLISKQGTAYAILAMFFLLMCSQNKPNTRLYPIGRAPKLVPTYHPALGEHDHGHLKMGECQATCEGLLGAVHILHNTNLGSWET